MVIQKSNNFKLDFDDSYQCAIADKYELGIVTMDNDFKKVEKEF